jgi:hypothetical protein
MADDIVIDKDLFHERLGNFVSKWKQDKRGGDQIFQGAGSIATVVGKQGDPGSYLKPAAFQVSFAHVLPRATRPTDTSRTAMAARLRVPRDPVRHHPRPLPDRHHQEERYVQSAFPRCAAQTPPSLRLPVAGRETFVRPAALTHSPASYLEPLKGGKVPVEILVRGKDADENKKQFEKCLDTIKKAGKKVAILKKDNATGGFADEWKAAFGEAGIKDEDQIELGPVLSQAAMSIKDAKELVRLERQQITFLFTDTS